MLSTEWLTVVDCRLGGETGGEGCVVFVLSRSVLFVLSISALLLASSEIKLQKI